ncbi:hypothetical protein QUF74_17460 [Candidatus Halobeggiatoa sp. HSG11]|nr:hypothetical protein [Candidatus Halobeggiatoa sp. HSG11]
MTPKQSLNPAFLKLKTTRSDIDNQESEEFHKNLVANFLWETYYLVKSFYIVEI